MYHKNQQNVGKYIYIYHTWILRFGIKIFCLIHVFWFCASKFLVKLSPPKLHPKTWMVSAIFGDRISRPNYLLGGNSREPFPAFLKVAIIKFADWIFLWQKKTHGFKPSVWSSLSSCWAKVPWFGGSFFSMAFNTLCSNVPGPVHAGSSFPRGFYHSFDDHGKKSWKKITQNVLHGRRSCLVQKPE